MSIDRRMALGVLSGAGLGALAAAQARTAAATAQSSQASPAGPSLGNLFTQIEAYNQTLEPRFSFLNSRFTNVERWKTEARTAYTQALSYHPSRTPVRARTISREQRRGYTQEELVFDSSPFAQVPASLLIPDKPVGSRAAIVALHEHGGFYYFGRQKLLENVAEPSRLTAYKQQLYDGFSFAAEFARAGFAVLVIDAFYFGERRLLPETLPSAQARVLAGQEPGSAAYIDASNRLAGTYEDLTAKTLFLAGATWPGILAWDDMRSVDFLASRKEVNPERIGCVGLSVGGMRAALLAGLDGRIKSTVVCCFMSTARAMLRNHAEHHTWMLYAPRSAELLDLPDVASLTAPNWLLAQFGRRDTLFPADGQAAAAGKLTDIFRKAGAAERLKTSFWDAPHSFPKGMQDEALAWFRRSLA